MFDITSKTGCTFPRVGSYLVLVGKVLIKIIKIICDKIAIVWI